jgi:hypothetical protein
MKQTTKAKELAYITGIGVVAYLIGLSFFAYGWSPGPNYRNVTVDTKVNITGSPPIILAVSIINPYTLNAGSMTNVSCNISIRDYNGFNDLENVNATLFHSSSSESAVDNNNTHYSNSSCAIIAGQQGGFFVNYTCTFQVKYHALNGTWNCTARVNDTANLNGTGSNLTNFSALLALNVTPTLIDYGNISTGETSQNITVNVTNLGNVNINVSVFGYARQFLDNLSFVCDYGNYTIDLQHFAPNITADFVNKQNLTSAYQAIAGLMVNKTNNNTYSLNSTYWQFYADQAQLSSGNCTGFVVFQAGAANI